jgi:hypothetical protein
MSHTPAPWSYEKALGGHAHPLCIFAHGDVIAKAYADGAPTAEANARLIAAAPELLQALRNAHTVLALLNQGDVKQDPLAREALRIELMARLAIAKAEAE